MSECRVCLTKNVRMHSVYQTWYQEMYEKLSGSQLNSENGRPNTVCYICYSQLQKFSQFFKMSQNTEKILTKRFQDGIEMQESQDRISILNLTMTLVQSISYIDDGKDVEPEITVTIKEEPVDFEEMETLKEEFLDSPPLDEAHSTDETPMDTPQHVLHLPQEPTESKAPNSWTIYPDMEINPNDIKNETTTLNEGNNLDLAQTLQELSEILEKIPLNKPPDLKLYPKKNFEASYFCSSCNYRCHTAKTLKHHLKVHDPSNSYSCEHCLYRFIDEKKLAKHKNYCTVCTICGKQFSNIGGLRTHVRLHTGEQPYSCNICGRGFNQKTNLRTHLRVHDREMQYPCNICQKSFPFKSFLTRHMLIHNENLKIESVHQVINCHKLFAPKKKKSFNICSVCGKILQSKEGLNMHMRLHTGEQPFSCESCQKVFNQKCNLQTHVERVHAGHELFSCEICHKMFPFNSELKKHVVSHIKGKLSARDFDIFQQKYIFLMHKKLHLGQATPYPCDMCTTRILSY